MARTLEADIKSVALKEGAARVGIARREAFAESPPSADMQYVTPWAKSVVSFAISLGTDWIEDYFGKVTRMTFKGIVYDTYRRIYHIGSIIEGPLKEAGFKTYNIIPNGVYRPDHTFEKEIPDQDIKPPLSLRYMAVGAGVGRLGWSGNLLVPGAWSNVYLGAVLTDAMLTPDGFLEDNLCDNCRICARVCPVGFIHMQEKTSVVIGGREHAYNKKRGDLRCIIGCGGYTGLSKDGTWSTWSTGRTILPEDDAMLPDLYRELRGDPANVMAARNLTFGSRGVLDRPLENTNPTCNNCGIVCSGPLKHREALMNLLFISGVVERDESGREIVIRPEDQAASRHY